MPSETSNNKNSNLKIVAYVAVFALVAAGLFFLYTQQNSSTNKDSDKQTTTEAADQTYTSELYKYSITFPSTWTEQVVVAPGNSGPEILMLNLEDNASRSNGKPNIILTAGVPSDACAEAGTSDDCKELAPGIIVTVKANGDQATIDKVLASFTINQ